MRLREVLSVLAIALGTTAVILALAWPRPVDAVGTGGSQLQALIASPGQMAKAPTPQTNLEAFGCRFTLSAGTAKPRPDQSTLLVLDAKNLTDRPVEAKLRLQILASSRPSPMARVLPRPESVWSGDQLVVLQPGEAKSLRIAAEVQVPHDAELTLAMSPAEG